MIEVAPRIFISEEPASSLSRLLSSMEYSKIAILVDEHTEKHCLPLIKDIVENTLLINIPSGEINKNIQTCTTVWKELTKANFDRNALVINLGGGVIGDLGGFCAATFKRGIRFLNIPTTLLAQVDASVGGKLGIDFLDFKNQIGVFTEPEFVMIYPGFLNTLPKRQLISGFAEVVKHALIQDLSLWEDLQQRDVNKIQENRLISRAVGIKHKLVNQDFKEQGVRRLLNFGHTLGHAVETYLLRDPHKNILHGEAVAAGMLMESFISFKKGFLPEQQFEVIKNYLNKIFPSVSISGEDVPSIIRLLYQDKKNINGRLRFTLLKEIGAGIYDIDIEEKETVQALSWYIKCCK